MDTIPTEIFEQILEHLFPIEGGLYDLGQSSLVCKSWQAPAQRLIFQYIHIFYHEEWEKFKLVAERDAIIGCYVSSLNFEIAKDPDDIRSRATVARLFPNVTHLAFTRIGCSPGLGFASCFPRLESLDIHLQMYPSFMFEDLSFDIPPRASSGIALQVLRCPYMVMEHVLEWLDTTDTLARQSLCAPKFVSNGDMRLTSVAAAKRQVGMMYRFLRTYGASISDLELEIPEVEGYQTSPFTHVFKDSSKPPHTYNMTSLRLLASENGHAAIFELLKISADSLSCLHTLELHFRPAYTQPQTAFLQEELTDTSSSAVPIALTSHLERILIRTDPWRTKSRVWYQRLGVRFGPANRPSVMVLEVPDRYFASDSGDGEDEDWGEGQNEGDVGGEESRDLCKSSVSVAESPPPSPTLPEYQMDFADSSADSSDSEDDDSQDSDSDIGTDTQDFNLDNFDDEDYIFEELSDCTEGYGSYDEAEM